MDEPTRQRLIAINRDFYAREAEAFSSTRDHPWPGWKRVFEAVSAEPVSVLDVGCGNGRLAVYLHGSRDVRYVGVDTSAELVAVARARATAGRFEVCDAGEAPEGPFDVVAVFGVMHHVPAFERRVGLLVSLARRLAAGGRLAVTFWRFGNDPRFEGRLRDLGEDIDPAQLEPGDHLLLWGESETAGRYCHFAGDAELERVVGRMREAGFDVADRFRSDGRSGEFNEYLVWTPR